jgi:hypothetical protein
MATYKFSTDFENYTIRNLDLYNVEPLLENLERKQDGFFYLWTHFIVMPENNSFKRTLQIILRFFRLVTKKTGIEDYKGDILIEKEELGEKTFYALRECQFYNVDFSGLLIPKPNDAEIAIQWKAKEFEKNITKKNWNKVNNG